MTPDPLAQLRPALPSGFEIHAFLANGAQGAVFRGSVDGQAAAVKIFEAPPDSPRIWRELALLRSVRHPNLVRLLRYDEVQVQGGRYPILGYALIDGPNLRVSIREEVALPDSRAIAQLGAQVGGALEALWQSRIVHRDVKPENIVRSRDGSFVLVDVGIAKHLDLTTVTAKDAAPGTSGYKSPEQAAGANPLTIRSDLFGLGVTTYEWATRVHPFDRRQPLLGESQAPPLAARRPDLPAALCHLVDRMLHIHKTKRPSSVSSAFTELAQEG